MSIRLSSSLSCFFAFVIGFITIAGVIHVVTDMYAPKAHIGLIEDKRQILETEAQDYNLIFLGTSQTFRNINPEIVSKNTQCNFKAYNAGVPGLTLEELDDYVQTLKKTADIKKPRLIVFADPLPPKPKFDAALNDRTQAYTSINNLKTRFKNVWSLPEPIWKRIALGGFVGTSQLYNALNIGRLSQWLLQDKYDSEIISDAPPMKAGFPSLTYDIDNDPAIAKRHEMFQKISDTWQKDILETQTKEGFDAIENIKKYRRRVGILSDLASRISQAGDIPILIIFPEPDTLKQDRTLESAVSRYAPELPILMTAEPKLFPQLWNKDVWFDKTHLNEKGAKILSREISAPLCSFLGKNGDAS